MSTLTRDQQKALGEILAAVRPSKFHLLTGNAGSGKTTLMQEFAREVMRRSMSIVLTAPTHKAVAVLARKLLEAGLSDVGCRTIQSLLSLKPRVHGDRQVFVRSKRAEPVMEDIVVIDECSMIGADVMDHIRRHLPNSFVLFVGDPAQLPPVGETASQTFSTKARSHLDTIVRQAAGNPILEAANCIRISQGGVLDMSWCKSAKAPPLGVFRPGDPDAWMQRAFTSPEFNADPDTFRYLAWTNDRVHQVNAKVRRWRYGEAITPFVPGERALVRAPIIRDETVLFSTNQEADVVAIEPDAFDFDVPRHGDLAGWKAIVPSWRVTLRRSADETADVHMIATESYYNKAIARITDEAKDSRERWRDLHHFKGAMARLQSIYAMTVHTSQGSTFRSVFMDVADIRRRASENVLEAQQLFYVAATRPTHALMLVG